MLNVADFRGLKRADGIDSFYDIQSIIGTGTFGEVAKARSIFANEYRAIKMISKKQLRKKKVLMDL